MFRAEYYQHQQISDLSGFTVDELIKARESAKEMSSYYKQEAAENTNKEKIEKALDSSRKNDLYAMAVSKQIILKSQK